jgi:hypothetical protein
MNIFFWFTAIFISLLGLCGIYQIIVEINGIIMWISEIYKDITFSDFSIICLIGVVISAALGYIVDMWNDFNN